MRDPGAFIEHDNDDDDNIQTSAKLRIGCKDNIDVPLTIDEYYSVVIESRGTQTDEMGR